MSFATQLLTRIFSDVNQLPLSSTVHPSSWAPSIPWQSWQETAACDYVQVGSSAMNLTKEQTKISIWVALLANIIGEAYISSRISWPIGTYIQNIVGSRLKWNNEQVYNRKVVKHKHLRKEYPLYIYMFFWISFHWHQISMSLKMWATHPLRRSLSNQMA